MSMKRRPCLFVLAPLIVKYYPPMRLLMHVFSAIQSTGVQFALASIYHIHRSSLFIFLKPKLPFSGFPSSTPFIETYKEILAKLCNEKALRRPASQGFVCLYDFVLGFSMTQFGKYLRNMVLGFLSCLADGIGLNFGVFHDPVR
ncbi:hypothetical protein AMTRI_Chr10g4660 [Amborella trichopoda]